MVYPKRYFLLAFVCLLFNLRSLCRLPCTITHFTNENGLPVNGIKGMEYDARTGLLWIGTEGGAVRYDGSHFDGVGSTGPKAISPRINWLQRGRNDSIYYQTENSDLYVVRGSQPFFLGRDKDAYSFFGTTNQPIENLIHRYKTSSNRYPQVDPSFVIHPFKNKQDVVMLMDNGTVMYLDGRQQTTVGSYGKTCTFLMLRESVFVVADNVFYKFNGKTSTLEKLQIKSDTLMPDLMGPLRIIGKNELGHGYIFQRGRLWKIGDQVDDILSISLISDGLPPDCAPDDIVEIAGTGVYVMSDLMLGLYVLRPNQFAVPLQTFIDKRSLAIRTPKLAMTADSGLYNWPMRPVKGVRPMFRMSGGYIWQNTGNTVLRTKIITRKKDTFILDDSTGFVVHGHTNGKDYEITDFSIYEVNDTSVAKIYSHDLDPVTHLRMHPVYVVEISNGLLAIGSETGLYTFNTIARRLIKISFDQEVKIRSLWLCDNHLFISTYGQGLFAMQDGILKPLPIDKNKYLLYAHVFVPDRNGFCWISTNHGLFKVSIKALIMAYDNNLAYIYYHYLGKEDGMQVTEFNGAWQPSGMVLPDGRMRFDRAGAGAYVDIDPTIIECQPPGHGVAVGTVNIDSIVLAPPDLVLDKLSSGVKKISFQVVVPYFLNRENLYCWYRLSSYQENWQVLDISRQRDIVFENLPPGNYSLEIKMLTGFEPGQEQIYKLPFSIRFPWYRQWWAYLLFLFALLFKTGLLIKWRTNKLLRQKHKLEKLVEIRTQEVGEKNLLLVSQIEQMEIYQKNLELNDKMKSRIMSVISHDILTPLRYIHKAGKTLLHERDRLSTPLQEKAADSISTTAKELEMLTMNMMNWIRFQQDSVQLNVERFSLYDLTEQIIALLKPMAIDKGIELLNNLSSKAETIQYKEACGIIIYNILVNSISYSESGRIVIACSKNETQTVLSIADEGPGMTEEKIAELMDPYTELLKEKMLTTKKNGFGYLIIKDLIHVVKGSLAITSVSGKGTMVTVTFPMLELRHTA